MEHIFHSNIVPVCMIGMFSSPEKMRHIEVCQGANMVDALRKLYEHREDVARMLGGSGGQA